MASSRVKYDEECTDFHRQEWLKNLITERLSKHVYFPCEITPVIWKHYTITVTFFLTVNDFGVKYVGKEYMTHLVDEFQQ